ncbi:Uncharacterised protein [Serratia fonticola]|uniref:Uncharacterized protein n=1 Tax=Serratia fonticola TaxID=47917 RepID=A0A4U9TBE4_SERFO|nr:Uncharacterised protein [Serratia fonticola]
MAEGLSEQALRFIAAQGLRANVVQQAEDIQTLLALVAAGIGRGAVAAKHCVYCSGWGRYSAVKRRADAVAGWAGVEPAAA